jgi:two-component system, sensor histidine kinase PdtaS
MRLYIIIALILLPLVKCMAQFYPAPPPIGYQKEPQLLQQFRNAHSDLEIARIQLQLCNLYFNKPRKKKADLQTALRYANEAAARSEKLHDSPGYNHAEVFIADIFADLRDFSSAEKILPLVNDSAKIDLLLMLCFKYRFHGDATESELEKDLAFAEQARQLSVRLHQPEKEALALLDIAAVHVIQKKAGTEQELLNLPGKFRSIGYAKVPYVYLQLTQLKYQEGDRAKSIYYSLETIKSMKLTGDSLDAGDFYLWLAASCYGTDDFQQAIDYSQLAIEGYALHAGEYSIAYAAYWHVWGLRKLNRFPESLEFMKHMLQEYPPQNRSEEVDYNSTIGNIYRDMKLYDKAEPYFLRAYKLNQKIYHPTTELDRDLGQLYVETHQYEKARPFLNSALKAGGPAGYIGYLHYLMFLVDSAAGNYLAAIDHLNRNHKQVDSSLAESRQRDIEKLLIQFEMQKKEDSIKLKDENIVLLNEKTAILNQKAAIQQSKLNRTALLMNITIGGVFLVLVIAALLYRENRNKKQVNKVITQKNELLDKLLTEKEKLLTEKEWLLKEVHHRVKNNLHTIMCLLESQASRLQNEGLAAVEDSQHRIYAMSLIHKKLYQSEDFKSILMDKYIAELVEYLDDSFKSESGIQFILDIEALRLNITQAIPVALIINEAVTNSMKHAFPDKRPGMVTISMHKNGDQITLLLADNGVGIGDRPTVTDTNSLGLELMKGLAREIHGRIEFASQSGTKITMIFHQDTPILEWRQLVKGPFPL